MALGVTEAPGTGLDRRPWAIGGLGVVFAAGVHLDGWAHNHGRVDDSFFTIWHAVLYSGFVALAVTLARPVVRRRAAGVSWARAAEPWERLALVGIVVFLGGGLGDMAWHTAFGVEQDLEALLSPTHLLLATGGTFMGTAAYLGSGRVSDGGWSASGPAVLAAVALWSIVTFMTQFMHPLVELWPTPEWRLDRGYGDLGAALGVAGFVFQAAVAAAIVLVLLRDDKLPTGAIALMTSLNAALAVTQGDDMWLVVPVAVGGVALEGIRRVLEPSPSPGWRLRVFGAAVGAASVGFIVVGYAVGPGLSWSAELWAGSVVSGSLVGALMSTVVVAPVRTG